MSEWASGIDPDVISFKGPDERFVPCRCFGGFEEASSLVPAAYAPSVAGWTASFGP
jgi:hypothetical protein